MLWLHRTPEAKKQFEKFCDEHKLDVWPDWTKPHKDYACRDREDEKHPALGFRSFREARRISRCDPDMFDNMCMAMYPRGREMSGD